MQAERQVEVLIAGGGLIGLTLGHALAGAGLEVLVVAADPPERIVDDAFDGRASAIARGNQVMLETLGLWEAMAADAAPILDIRVSDGRPDRGASPLHLHFSLLEGAVERAGDGAAETGGAMGWIVPNQAIRRSLTGALGRARAPAYLTPEKVVSAEPAGPVARVRLSDGTSLSARLVIAADGGRSGLRQAAGIRVAARPYSQTAIVATVAHERDHEGVAHEHFLPSGPFALLPMTDTAEGRHRSSLVWTERHALAQRALELPAEAFDRELQRRFGGSLGRLEAPGRRWSYPLQRLVAHRLVAERLALVGDAGHVIHPIAGQGLNLGLRDVAELAEILVDAARLGLDLGAPDLLAEYQRRRRLDIALLVAATDGLNRLFSNDLPPIRLARDLGLAAVERLPGLKRLFVDRAMGVSGRGLGRMPRLVRGERL